MVDWSWLELSNHVSKLEKVETVVDWSCPILFFVFFVFAFYIAYLRLKTNLSWLDLSNHVSKVEKVETLFVSLQGIQFKNCITRSCFYNIFVCARFLPTHPYKENPLQRPAHTENNISQSCFSSFCSTWMAGLCGYWWFDKLEDVKMSIKSYTRIHFTSCSNGLTAPFMCVIKTLYFIKAIFSKFGQMIGF